MNYSNTFQYWKYFIHLLVSMMLPIFHGQNLCHLDSMPFRYHFVRRTYNSLNRKWLTTNCADSLLKLLTMKVSRNWKDSCKSILACAAKAGGSSRPIPGTSDRETEDSGNGTCSKFSNVLQGGPFDTRWRI